MKYKFIHILVFVFIISSCTDKGPGVATITLKRSDYIDLINAGGTIQAVNNISLVTPQVMTSNLKIIKLVKDGIFVHKGDTVCVIEAPDLAGNFENSKTDLEKMEAELRSRVADNAMQLSLLDAQSETNSAQLKISMLDSVQMNFAPPVKQKLLSLEMQKVTIEKEKIRKKLIARHKINDSELAQLKSRIAMQNNMIQMYQGRVKSLKLVAPCDGFAIRSVSPFLSIGKFEEGSRVYGGMSIVQIPDITTMQVSVEVPEADYKRITNDQKVLISVESAGNLQTTGKVLRKSLAGKKPDEKSQILTYEVIVSVDSCHSKMAPGLSADCRIIINQVKDTLVIPSASIFIQDSLKTVYVARDGKFIPVTVETGISNNSWTIISKGLKGNETIALMTPSHNLIRKRAKAEKNVTKSNDVLRADTVPK